jgi:signal transduction histidine kinase
MNIRQKLTLLFLVLSFTILAFCFVIILYTQITYREEQFRERLELKTRSIENSFAEQGTFSIEQLRRIQRSSAQLFNEQVFLVDQTGLLIFSAPSSTPRFHADSALINKAREEPFHFFVWKNYECCALLSNHTPGPVLIIVAGYDQYGFNKIGNLKELLTVLLIAGLFVSALIGWFYAGKALSPVNEIIRQVDAITIGNLSSRLHEGNRMDELARLAITFNKLLYRISAAFEAQKSFVANASHELRTPLTIISGRLELALLRVQNEEEYRNAIKEVLADIRHLNQICTSLLILAQSQNKSDDIRFIPLRIDELIWLVRTEFLRMNQDSIIEVVFLSQPEEDSDFIVYGNEQLLRTALINLIDNACKFSTDHEVKVGLQFNSDEMRISFSDDGPGIDGEDISRLMQPFFRGRHGSEKTGFGLGLPMVENIIHLHGGRLEIQSTPGKGSTFTAIIPKNKAASGNHQ